MKVGFIGKLRRYAASTQREALVGAGVSATKIYDGTGKETISDLVRSLRSGDVVCVYRLAALASDRAGWRDFTDEIAGKTLRLFEVSTGRECQLPHVLAEMIADATDDWAGNRITPKEAREAGKRGAKKRWGNVERTPIRVANKIWKDWANYPTAADALAHPDMHGWAQRRAYDKLGKRGAPAGPLGTREK